VAREGCAACTIQLPLERNNKRHGSAAGEHSGNVQGFRNEREKGQLMQEGTRTINVQPPV
jgi:hypothetical protein